MQTPGSHALPITAIQVHDFHGAVYESSSASSSPHIPSTPVAIEHSDPPASSFPSTYLPKASHKITNAVSQTFDSKTWDIRTFQIFSAFLALTAGGFHDACAGALIPYIQDHFHITYSIVSLLFVGQCAGFIGASLANTYLSDLLGIGKVLTIGALIQIFGYVLIVPSLPFPVLITGYGFSGFGIALQEAQMNAYIASLPNSASKLSWLHAFYGLGAFVSPLIATAMAENGIRYNFYYLVLIGICFLNLFCILGAFRLKRDSADEDTVTMTLSNIQFQQHFNQDIETHAVESPVQEETPTTVPSTPTTNNISQEKYESSSAKLKKILSQRVTVVSFTFLVLYVGTEVSIGGWIVSYLIDHRNGGASAGYVSSGFWGGITVGRIFLMKLNTLVGEKRVIWLYTALCIGLELVVWLAPVFIADAVAVSLIGFFMGPFYPIVMSLMTKILPRSLHTGAIGFAAALGQTGSAIFPFVVGTMAQQLGVSVLHPILLVLFTIMGSLWTLMPTPQRRRE